MAKKTPEKTERTMFTDDQYRRIAALGNGLSRTTQPADFSKTTLLTFRLNSATPVAELANEFLLRTHTIEYEEKKETLMALGGYAVEFSELSPEVREKHSNILPGISSFYQYMKEMRSVVRNYSIYNEPKVDQVGQFLSYVILESISSIKDKDLSETG